jgi:hypothetical protein
MASQIDSPDSPQKLFELAQMAMSSITQTTLPFENASIPHPKRPLISSNTVGRRTKRQKVNKSATGLRLSFCHVNVNDIVVVDVKYTKHQKELVWDLGRVTKVDGANFILAYFWEPKTVGRRLDNPEILKCNHFFDSIDYT